MLASTAARSLARRTAINVTPRIARPSTSAFSTSAARPVEKGPAGVPISGGDGNSVSCAPFLLGSRLGEQRDGRLGQLLDPLAQQSGRPSACPSSAPLRHSSAPETARTVE
jgi:hypothetical protein